MSLIDRYLVRRFLTNFVILFALVFVLATSIDIILQLDEFRQVVESRLGRDAGAFKSTWMFVHIVVNFHAPRVFQLYAYLLGLVSVGAMGFTLAQMHRHRELVAMLASGMSLYRVAWPIVASAFLLNLLHLVNSNLVLPQLAPLLIRTHNDLASSGMEGFPVPLTRDGSGALIQSPSFDRLRGVLASPTMIERDERGATSRRISAASATWDEAANAWRLEKGVALIPAADTDDANQPDELGAARRKEFRTDVVEWFPSDLTPRVLVVRRYAEFAQMLDQRQIEELIATPGVVDVPTLARIKYGRYSVIFTNMLMLLLTLPFFLLRAPANLLRQSVWCATASVLVMLGGFVGMEVEFAALPAAVGVFLPVIVLIPLTLAAATFIRT